MNLIDRILAYLNEYSKICPSLRNYDFVCEAEVWMSKLKYPLASTDATGYYENNLQALFKYISVNYSQKGIDIAFAANCIGLSRYEFCRFFKKQTNMTFITYINKVRIEQAARMLLETKLSCANIGYDCGFSNPSYFDSLFKKYYGILPVAYRRDRIGF
jgi:AraC-like DNA-binding protein